MPQEVHRAATGRVELLVVEGIPPVKPGDDLASLVVASATDQGLALFDRDILVFAQKIVSKSESRYVSLKAVNPSANAIEIAKQCQKDPRYVEIVLRESKRVLRAGTGVLITEDKRGLVLANAGVDRSNVDQVTGDERVLLLPQDPDRSAATIREGIAVLTGLSVGVIINDSVGRAWRLGTIGTAIGASGIQTLWDRRGEVDIQGRRLESTEVGLADELASAASMVMGQADEGQPIVIIRGMQHAVGVGAARDLQRPSEKDLFR